MILSFYTNCRLETSCLVLINTFSFEVYMIRHFYNFEPSCRGSNYSMPDDMGRVILFDNGQQLFASYVIMTGLRTFVTRRFVTNMFV